MPNREKKLIRGLDVICMALLLFSIAVPAKAHWQYTQWTMTREQVVASARGTAHLVAGKAGDKVFGADLGAEGTYFAGGMRFKSQFYFDVAGRLRVVRLTPVDQNQCDSLSDSLGGIYGAPVESSSITRFWRDTTNGNGVRLTRLTANECFVAYTPLSSSGANGL